MNAVNMTITGNLVNGSTNILSTLNNKRNISDSYNKTETDGFLNSKVGYICDSNLLLDSFIVDIIRPKNSTNHTACKIRLLHCCRRDR